MSGVSARESEREKPEIAGFLYSISGRGPKSREAAAIDREVGESGEIQRGVEVSKMETRGKGGPFLAMTKLVL